jgi:hypothetical protein
MSTEQEKRGWLEKKWMSGGLRRKWERHFFLLDGTFLHYYEHEEKAESKEAEQGIISLKNAAVHIHVHRQRTYCFEVTHAERRPVCFDAKSEAEREEWMRLIITAAQGPVNAPKTVRHFYDVLGLPEDATLNQIKKTYRKLALKSHPDKGGNPEQFLATQEAYEVLAAVKETEIEEAEVQPSP